MTNRNVRLYIMGFIFIVLIILIDLGYEANGVIASRQQKNIPPLLLNSGLVEVAEAEVEVVFWFGEERSDSASSFLQEQIRSQSGWRWEIHGVEIQAANWTQGLDSKQSLTVSGYRHLNALEEAEIWTWFKTMAKKVELEGGKAYFDERVRAGIDGETYLRRNSFEPKQVAFSGTTSSIAGWQDGFFPEVKAGEDSVNIQLLTRSTSQGAMTVLAVPVLLEEF
ncbi:hypothetical protein [Desulfitobacterium metallireducens]|uniref:TATA-box binding protein n=1 Tax=Desulfitobacterium metallireducens DSM 15288 TaxID=871968 RepID=W0ECY1_9FIRM|nr:hypothetical protein [Desulfitobacterium metallireducens]AHF08710.1 hypothetical protein DESME_15445 [Desulfitobacterium metallireducens DSM 15288]